MKISKYLKHLLFTVAIIGCNAKNDEKKEKSNKPDKPIESKPKNVNCKVNRDCITNIFIDYFPDMAFCNVTSNTCTNYCFVNTPCKTTSDCNYSIGDPKKCGVECYRSFPEDPEGKCLIIAKEGQFCNNQYIICEEGLICDFYTTHCITRAEAQSQTGEPLFSLFLFMLIMLSLFNRQRADQDLINNLTPNELLMVGIPAGRRRPQEEDELPVYQPIGDTNEDELIEQNLDEVLVQNNESTELANSNSTVTVHDQGIIVEEDDLPLLPPTYDEAVSGYIDDNDDAPLINNTNNNTNNNTENNTNSSPSNTN